MGSYDQLHRSPSVVGHHIRVLIAPTAS